MLNTCKPLTRTAIRSADTKHEIEQTNSLLLVLVGWFQNDYKCMTFIMTVGIKKKFA